MTDFRIDFGSRFKQTRRGFIRLASICLSDWGSASALPSLVRSILRPVSIGRNPRSPTPATLLSESPSGSLIDFNQAWRFHEGPLSGAESPSFNDLHWRIVDLPHDWSIERPPNSATNQSPFNKDTPDGKSVGYLRGGTGWYRKAFILPETYAGRGLDIIFDGVQQESEVWVNGQYLGLQPHGSIGFTYDLTNHLGTTGERNVIAVRAVNPGRNSRWYAGSGIYRAVTLRSRNLLHIPVWGLRVDTLWVKPTEAQLQVRVELRNDRAIPQHVELQLIMRDPRKGIQTFDLGQLDISPQSTEIVSQEIRLVQPLLWSPASPTLYECEFRWLQGEHVVDSFTQTTGVRTIDVSAEWGLLINGREIKLRGGCMHQDNGLLGAAAFPEAEFRRVALMKRNGFNAIRTSHNPPSSAFLDACDRLGIIVMEEFTDMWELPKKPNGYSRYFDGHWRKDLTAMVARDFHHPSVVIWSIGNEIPERISPRGLELAAEMVSLLHNLDSRRPVTNAINSFSDDPQGHRDWDASAPAFAPLDIAGYNYMWGQYTADHLKFPGRVMVGTESNPDLALENWRLVEQNPSVIGDFVWTGMDHIGESGLGDTRYIPDGQPLPDRITIAKPWPAWINWCGDIDIVGDKKPQSFYRDVVWRQSTIEILVHAPIPSGQREVTSYWGWPDELPSWNWQGCEGEILFVKVLSRCPRVRLELNGRLLGEKAIDEDKGIAASFDVPYQPGTLRATALVGDRVAATCAIETSGMSSSISLSPETAEAMRGSSQLVYVPIEIRDDRSRRVPDADCAITVELAGPAEMAALGTACPDDHPLPGSLTVKPFRGRALAVIRRTGEPGLIRLTCRSPNLSSAEVFL